MTRLATHSAAFLAGAFAMLALMIADAVYGPFTLRRKPVPDEPGGGWDG